VYPDAVKEKNNSGSLPLHCACVSNAHLEIIRLLYSLYKEGASVPDEYGRVPAHYLNPNSQVSIFQVLPSPPPLPITGASFGGFGFGTFTSAAQLHGSTPFNGFGSTTVAPQGSNSEVPTIDDGGTFGGFGSGFQSSPFTR